MRKKSPEDYMRLALECARRGEGKVSPNPMVGCIVAKGGRILSKGYHEKYGGFHAERNALLRCGESAEGAELYVNLEPCCHQGKTPPCTDIILEKKIKKVYVGCLDPNPRVAGKGVKILREHGIEVEIGILEEECRRLNEVFFRYITAKMPFVAMKYAMTLDGKIACETGDSKWVSGTESRAYVQRLRNRYRGIMAGIGTVRMDDPLLNCRMEGGRDPVRIICDTRLRIPMDSQIVRTAGEIETVVAFHPQAAEIFRREQKSENFVSGKMHNGKADSGKYQDSVEETAGYLKSRGITLLEIPLREEKADTGQIFGREPDPQLDLKILLAELGRRGMDSILLEGGGTLNASALRQNLVQRVYAFVAPKLVAGANAKSPVGGIGISKMENAVELQDIQVSFLGKDICITARIGEEKTCLPES